MKAAGRPAAFFLLPGLNLILLLLLFYGGAKRISPAFGLCLAASTLFNVVVFENSVEIMSDIPSMALVGRECFYSGPEYREAGAMGTVPRRRLFRLFPRGSLLQSHGSSPAGLSPLARIQGRAAEEGRRDLTAFFGGAFLFGILPLAFYTYRLFGTVFRLVYEPLTQSRMNWASFRIGAPDYLRSTAGAFGIPGGILILIRLGTALARPKLRPAGIARLVAYLAFFGFYAFQSIQQDRYLLPAYPFLGVLDGLGVLAIVRRFDRLPGLTFLIVALCAAYPFFHSKGHYRPRPCPGRGRLPGRELQARSRRRRFLRSAERRDPALCRRSRLPLHLDRSGNPARNPRHPDRAGASRRFLSR